MSNQLTHFNFEGEEVRTVQSDEIIWFAMPDVARALNLSNSSVAVKALDDDERAKFNLGRQGNTNFISEPGLYKLIGASRKPEAKRFNRWVTHEVLPSIRKNGMYATPQAAEQLLNNPDMMIEILTRYKDAQVENQRLHDENTVMQPKALFADAVATSHTTILVGELAKLLKQNGVEIGQNRLFKWLRDNGYLIKRKGTDWNMPTQRSMGMELFKVKETSIAHSNGSVTVSKTVKVTGKGQQYFINKFLNGLNEEAM